MGEQWRPKLDGEKGKESRYMVEVFLRNNNLTQLNHVRRKRWWSVPWAAPGHATFNLALFYCCQHYTNKRQKVKKNKVILFLYPLSLIPG